jgi:hypothetical protein
MAKQTQGIQAMIQNIKGDLMVKIKENRDEYLGVFNSSEEDRQRMERLKVDKAESDNHSNR